MNKVDNMQKVPKLRFPEFSGDIKTFRLDDIALVERGKFSARPRNDPKYFGGNIPFVQTGDITSSGLYLTKISQTLNVYGLMVSKLFPANTVLVTIAANIGDTVITQFDVACTDSVVAIQVFKNLANSTWLKYALDLKKDDLDAQSSQNAQKNINLQVLKPLIFNTPTVSEQTKIADFLIVVNDKIQQLTKKKSLLEQYKKGLMQQIFSQKIRFKDDNGYDYPDWEEKMLGDVVIKNSQKNKNQQFINVQSVSNKFGFVNQNELFEDRQIASINLSNYYVIKQGFFAYNPSRIDVGSLAYKFDNLVSVISPLYVSFISNTEYIYDLFLLYWLNAPIFYKQMQSMFEGSVRNTLSFESLKNMLINMPCKQEQIKTADFLTNIDDKITLLNKELDQTKVYKKSLLQQMFV